MGGLTVDGMTGSGALGAVATGWSVGESATSPNITEQTGGTGTASFSAVKTPTSKFVVDNLITLGSEGLGTLEGIIGDVSVTGDSVGVTVAPLLSLLNAERNAPPTGEQALSTIFASYVALVTDQISVDYQGTADPLRIYPGWSGSVWNFLQQLCAFNRVEMVLNGSTLVVRDVGSVDYVLDAKTLPTFGASVASTGRSIDVVVQNTALIASLPGSKYNYSENPSVETNSTGWSTVNTSGWGSQTSARNTGWASSGAASWRCNITSFGSSSDPIAVTMRHDIDASALTTGEFYSASVAVRTTSNNITLGRPVIAGTGQYLSVRFDWLNASSAIIGTSNVQQFNQISSGEQTYSAPNMVKPSSATKMRISFSVPQFCSIPIGGGTSFPSNWLEDGDLLYMDAAMLTNGSIVPFFDGNSAGAVWAGSANNSVSSVLIPSENDFYNAFTDGNTIYSVSSGESVTTTVQTLNYPTYLAQPVASAVVPSVVGTYHVSGADNLPVVPAEWLAYGGGVSVAISEIPGAIDITLVGPSADIPGVPGPYSLSASDGGSQYATLSIAGIGVTTKPETLNLLTGADPTKTTVEVASTVNSPFCTTKAVAYDHSSWAVAGASGPNTSLSFSVPTGALNGFGLTEGATFTYEDARYRIVSVTIGHSISSITCVRHTTIGQMDAAWSGLTLGAFDTLWSGFSAGDVQIAPLRVS